MDDGAHHHRRGEQSGKGKVEVGGADLIADASLGDQLANGIEGVKVPQVGEVVSPAPTNIPGALNGADLGATINALLQRLDGITNVRAANLRDIGVTFRTLDEELGGR